MSAESKQRILDRLNAQLPKPSNWHGPGPARPGAYDPMLQQQVIDKSRPTFVIPLQIPLDLKAAFELQSTEWLYSVKDCLDKILASRSDAKR